MNKKIRLDKFLVEKLNVPTRNKACFLIQDNKIKINNRIINKPSYLISENDQIEIEKSKQYVSRGAFKLKEAIEKFGVNLEGKIVLDIGSSTGGFAQILLENNVKKIYCLDVGINQLDSSLKTNNKIVNLENNNFIKSNKTQFFDINFITCDVSFISIKKILNKIKEMNFKYISGIFLLKPQFELSQKEIKEGKGKVKEKYLPIVIDEFKNFCLSKQIKIKKIIQSPIKGFKKNNIEYLVYLDF